MNKFKRILIVLLVVSTVAISSHAVFGYDDDVPCPKSIIIPVVTE